MKTANVIGIMSGTSLDGVDIALCRFSKNNDAWSYELKCAETLNYNESWKERLSSALNSTSEKLIELHTEYGHFLGSLVKDFIIRNKCSADYVASHGHTVFHQPEKRMTFQVGDSSAIAAECGLPVVCDFRSGDVALGGQGAPLVPIGDKLLFPEYDFCLNLGGFANISYESNNRRIAYDICPVNILLNRYANLFGKQFDEGGRIACMGKLNNELFSELNALEYYSLGHPKSLGREWVEGKLIPLVEKYRLSVEDTLHTLSEHMAWQISCAMQTEKKGRVLVTGGGAFNDYFISRIQEFTIHHIVIPEKNTVEFKEALIFAFLGFLRMNDQVNCLSSVTGASHDHTSGAIYLP